MDSDRVDGIVSALRAREVMAHRADEGVYEYGVRVVIPDGSEALWTMGGAAGLRAEVLRDGVLVGFVPYVPGSESFTDRQIIDTIAAAHYDEEALYPASRTIEHPARSAAPPPPPQPPPPPAQPPPPAMRRPHGPWRPHWLRRP
ncbi:hypothetical protein [Streptomyces sp. NPDC058045]|uniref:hypothetical protein n=1 Tax=Streptomyces sp. NPDC058045 TaxID=3346311 RepID=UPI0036E44EC5